MYSNLIILKPNRLDEVINDNNEVWKDITTTIDDYNRNCKTNIFNSISAKKY